MAGTLFVVATPIGNLEDLTFRALRTLKEVDLIAAEDTRRTSRLLAHYGISRPLVSLHEHNEHREAPRLVGRLAAGESIALVSDAGTPGISDPGASLVRLARTQGMTVVPVPGASAITTALSVTGLPVTPFTFLGFPPSSGADRDRWFERVFHTPGAAVFFESPHRIARTSSELADMFPERPIFVFRELSKINEELVVYTKGENLEERGEFVVVLAPPTPGVAKDLEPIDAYLLVEQLTSSGLSESDALTAAAALRQHSTLRIAKLAKKGKILAKRQSATGA